MASKKRSEKNSKAKAQTLKRSRIRGMNPKRFKDFRGTRESFILKQK